MKNVILIIFLLANSNLVFAEWTSKTFIDPMTDSKVGVASTQPTPDTEIGIICKNGERPRFTVKWKESNSAKNITHFEYRIDNEKTLILNVSSVIGDRTTISLSSIESVLKDLIKKNRLVLKGVGPNYETSVIVVNLDKSSIAIKKACSWHSFYKKTFNRK